VIPILIGIPALDFIIGQYFTINRVSPAVDIPIRIGILRPKRGCSDINRRCDLEALLKEEYYVYKIESLYHSGPGSGLDE
jgi:hypothetical protein